MHDNNGNEIAYASFTVSDFCVRIKSGLDQNLCGIDNQNAEDWAGSELKVGADQHISGLQSSGTAACHERRLLDFRRF